MHAATTGRNLKFESDSESDVSKSNIESELDENEDENIEKKIRDTKRVVEKKLDRKLKDANERIEAIKTIRKERQKNYKEWKQMSKKMNGNTNAIIQMLKFQDPNLAKSRFLEFENDWKRAKDEILDESYDRKTLLNEFKTKPSKDQVIFQRKSVRNIPAGYETTKSDGKIVTVAHGKMSALDQVERLRSEQHKSMRRAKETGIQYLNDSDDDEESISSSENESEQEPAPAPNKYGQLQNRKRAPIKEKLDRINRERSSRTEKNLSKKSLSSRSTRKFKSGRTLPKGRSTHKIHDTSAMTASDLLFVPR